MSVCAVSQWVPPFDTFSHGPTLQFTLRWTGQESDIATPPMTRPLATRNTHTSGSENQRTNTPKPSQTVGMAMVNFPIMIIAQTFYFSFMTALLCIKCYWLTFSRIIVSSHMHVTYVHSQVVLIQVQLY